MNSRNNPLSKDGGNSSDYRQEDLDVLAVLDKIDRKLRSLKIATVGLGILFIALGVWFVAERNSSETVEQEKQKPLASQKLDSIQDLNRSLQEKQQSLKDRLRDHRATIDSLQKKLDEKASDSEVEEMIQTYEIKENDNLWKIAEKFYNDGHQMEKIIEANNIKEPDLLRVGQKLEIPK